MFYKEDNIYIKICQIIILSVIFLFFSQSVLAIDTAELERQLQDKQNQIAELQKQIDQYNAMIKNKKGEELTLKNQISILTSQINKLELEINLTESQISATDMKINESMVKIEEKEGDIVKQKENLVGIIRALDEYDKENLVEIILKNNAFSSFFAYIEQMENLQDGVQEKVEKIKFLKTELEKERDNLSAQKEILEGFQDDLENKQSSLGQQKGGKNKLLTQTKNEEKKYQTLLNSIIAQKSAFSKEIQALEQQILATKGFALHITATKIPQAGSKILSRPNGILTQGYGMTAFAKRGAYGGAPHNGMDFANGAGTPVKVAAGGIVVAKGYNKGWGNWIAVKHPELYNMVTIYAHMNAPSIRSIGETIGNNAVLGYEGSTGFSTGSHLHISLYSDFFTYFKNGELYFNYFEGSLNPANYF